MSHRRPARAMMFRLVSPSPSAHEGCGQPRRLSMAPSTVVDKGLPPLLVRVTALRQATSPRMVVIALPAAPSSRECHLHPTRLCSTLSYHEISSIALHGVVLSVCAMDSSVCRDSHGDRCTGLPVYGVTDTNAGHTTLFHRSGKGSPTRICIKAYSSTPWRDKSRASLVNWPRRRPPGIGRSKTMFMPWWTFKICSTSKTYLKFHILLVWSFTMVKSVNDGELCETKIVQTSKQKCW